MQNEIENHIARILSGEASAEDYFMLTQWLNEDERHKEEFQLLQTYWNAKVSVTEVPQVNESINIVLNKIANEENKKNRKKILYRFIGIAAIICILFILPSIWITEEESKIAQEYYTYITSDSKSNIVLSDGTKVVLNKNSKLTYSNQYGMQTRMVQLDGEAYFDVMHDKKHPFEVKMGDSKITVLGTIFNVKAFMQNECITATLIEGSILFENANQKVKITPNQQLKYNKNSSNVTIDTVNVDYTTAWKDDIYKYKSIELQELIQHLEQLYDVRIILAEEKSLKKEHVSGSFYCSLPINEVLDIITRSTRLHWFIKDDIYYIEPDV